MSWRVVVVSSSAKVDFKMEYLVVRTMEETSRVHVSEIAVLMLESTAVSVTAYALCELIAHKVKVMPASSSSMRRRISPRMSWRSCIPWRSTRNGASFCWNPMRAGRGCRRRIIASSTAICAN